MMIRIVLYDGEMEIVTKDFNEEFLGKIKEILVNNNVRYTQTSTRIVVFNPSYALLNELAIEHYLVLM